VVRSLLFIFVDLEVLRMR